MGDGVRGWQLVGIAAFVGGFVVPVLGLLLYGVSSVQSLSTSVAGAGTADVRPGFVLVRAGFVVALAVAGPGLALALYRDASGLDGRGWDPDPRLCSALGLVYPLSVVVAGVYLYRRYRRVGLGYLSATDPLSRAELRDSRWWYAVAAGPVLLLSGVGLLLVPFPGTTTFLGRLYVRIAGFVLLSGTGVALFDVGLAADLAIIRNGDVSWQPGVRRYQFGPLLVPAVAPVVALVYLVNRHRHLGSP